MTFFTNFPNNENYWQGVSNSSCHSSDKISHNSIISMHESSIDDITDTHTTQMSSNFTQDHKLLSKNPYQAVSIKQSLDLSIF